MAKRTSFIGVKSPDVALQSALEKIQAASQVWVQRTSEGFSRGWYTYYANVAYPLFLRMASMINSRGGKQALKVQVKSPADVARNYAAVGAPFAYAAHVAGRLYRQLAQRMIQVPPAMPYAPPVMSAPPAPAGYTEEETPPPPLGVLYMLPGGRIVEHLPWRERR